MARNKNRRKIRLSIESLEGRQMLAADSVTGRSAEEVEQKIDSLKAYFDEVMGTWDSSFKNLSLLSGTNGQNLYNLQFAVDGVLSMYEATGDRDVLDKAISYITNVMEAAETIEGGYHETDGFLDWEVLSGGKPRARREGFMLYDIQIGSAMSRLARILHEDTRLQNVSDLQNFGNDLTDFVDEQIVNKWLNVRSNRGWLEGFQDQNGYWVGRATQFVNVCHNLTQILGTQSSCHGIETVLAEQFRDLLVVQADGSYGWNTWATLPSGNLHLAPDTGHENLTATMVSRLAGDNFVFDEDDVYHLGKTFTERIWNGRTTWEVSPSIEESPWFHNYIDGSDENYRNYTHYRDGTEGMNGFVYDGWIRLGQFVPEVQLAGESLLAFIQDIDWGVNASLARNGSQFGKIALAGHLARNLRFSEFATAATSNVPTDALFNSFDASSARLPGDANRDGAVSFSDFLVLSGNFGREVQAGENGDFDGNAVVDFADFLIISSNFGAKSEQMRNVSQ